MALANTGALWGYAAGVNGVPPPTLLAASVPWGAATAAAPEPAAVATVAASGSGGSAGGGGNGGSGRGGGGEGRVSVAALLDEEDLPEGADGGGSGELTGLQSAPLPGGRLGKPVLRQPGGEELAARGPDGFWSGGVSICGAPAVPGRPLCWRARYAGTVDAHSTQARLPEAQVLTRR